MKRKAAIFILFALALASCGGFNPLSWGQEKLSAPGTALFRDDFSDPASGWSTRVAEGQDLAGYDAGRFRFWLNTLHHTFWSTPGKTFTNISLEVDAARLGGPENNAFGLLCRYQPDTGFYGFLISTDGYYAIIKKSQNKVETIGNIAMDISPAIKGGEEVNHLRAECNGVGLSFYVNDVKLAEVADTDFAWGDVGILVEVFEEKGVDIGFDSFIVNKLEAKK